MTPGVVTIDEALRITCLPVTSRADRREILADVMTLRTPRTTMDAAVTPDAADHRETPGMTANAARGRERRERRG
jgi:hypothetical protein